MISADKLLAWIESSSQGFAGIPNFRTRSFGQNEKDLIEAYQLSGLAGDIHAHRQDGVMSPRLATLLELILRHTDASSRWIFRGVGLDGLHSIGDVFQEQSISGWTLYPKIALNLARVQKRQYNVVFAERCGQDTAGLYIDEWEEEIVRPPLTKIVGEITHGVFDVRGVRENIALITIG